jgi:hypothetical protein
VNRSEAPAVGAAFAASVPPTRFVTPKDGRGLVVALLSEPRVTLLVAPSSTGSEARPRGSHLMRSCLPALAVLAVGLLAGCSTEPESAPPAAATPSATVAFVGPSGSEIESEEAARAALEAQRAEAERLAAEAAAQAAAEAAAQQAAQAAAARRAADEVAAAQAVIDAEGDDGYVSSDLEVRCSDGTATVEECFGPGSDLNGNGIADINE